MNGLQLYVLLLAIAAAIISGVLLLRSITTWYSHYYTTHGKLYVAMLRARGEIIVSYNIWPRIFVLLSTVGTME